MKLKFACLFVSYSLWYVLSVACLDHNKYRGSAAIDLGVRHYLYTHLMTFYSYIAVVNKDFLQEACHLMVVAFHLDLGGPSDLDAFVEG